MSRAALGEDERDQAGEAGSTGAEHLGGRPAGVGRLRERVHDPRETGRGEQGSAKVESAPARRGSVWNDDPVGGEGETEADGSVDQEDRLPADKLGQCSTEKHSDGRTGAADRAPGSKSVRPLMTLAEGAHQDRERGRG